MQTGKATSREKATSKREGRADDGAAFRVGITRDLLGEGGAPIFDIGLEVIEEDERIKWEFMPSHEDELSPRLVEPYDALVVFSPSVTRHTVVGAGRLKLVARLGVGFDRVDLQACTDQGIVVTNTPDGVRRPMAVSAIAYVLALAHRLLIKDRITRAGAWDEKWRHVGLGLRDRTLGIVGLGNIGRDIVELATPFGLRCVAADPYVTEVDARAAGAKLMSLEQLLGESDFVCLTCPLSDETRHLIDEHRLSLMRPDAYLINVARGPIVDHAALTASLVNCRLAGAALDVFEQEPLDPGDRLLELDSVIVAPHAIGHTDELFRDCGRSSFGAVRAMASGNTPDHVVNREVLHGPEFARKLGEVLRA
jgi:phosphoglycerate dehydrogenase-like enzyme